MNDIDTLITSLQTYIDRNQLVKADVAKKLSMSPSGLSHLLARDFNPTGAQTLAILKLTKGNKSMNTNQNPINATSHADYSRAVTDLQLAEKEQNELEGVEQGNAAVIRRYLKSGTKLINFQSGLGLTENDGFVPREGVSEPEFSALVAELVAQGRYNEAKDLLTQIQKQVNVVHSTAQKAAANPNGVTQPTVAVKGSGERSIWAAGNAFSANSNGGVLNMSDASGKYAVEFAKKDIETKYAADISENHNLSPSRKIHFAGDIYNEKKVDLEKIKRLHEERKESLLADDDTYKLNLQRIKADKERETRLANGRGTIADLAEKLNALKA